MEPRPVPSRPVAPFPAMAAVAPALAALADRALAQTPDTLPSPGALKGLSDDIRRSGASSVPEALRLASNLQVAQVNSSRWAARGFNNQPANKLLVLIDSVVGQNLIHGEHAEFIPSSPSPRRIERGVYRKIT